MTVRDDNLRRITYMLGDLQDYINIIEEQVGAFNTKVEMIYRALQLEYGLEHPPDPLTLELEDE